MNIKWAEVFSSDFWFSIDSSRIHASDWVIGYAGAGLVVAGIALLVIAWRSQNKLLKSPLRESGNIILLAGALEMLWFWFRYQQAAVLGTKFAAIIIGVLVLVWLVGPIFYFLRRYPSDVKEYYKQIAKEKYLNM